MAIKTTRFFSGRIRQDVVEGHFAPSHDVHRPAAHKHADTSSGKILPASVPDKSIEWGSDNSCSSALRPLQLSMPALNIVDQPSRCPEHPNYITRQGYKELPVRVEALCGIR